MYSYGGRFTSPRKESHHAALRSTLPLPQHPGPRAAHCSQAGKALAAPRAPLEAYLTRFSLHPPLLSSSLGPVSGRGRTAFRGDVRRRGRQPSRPAAAVARGIGTSCVPRMSSSPGQHDCPRRARLELDADTMHLGSSKVIQQRPSLTSAEPPPSLTSTQPRPSPTSTQPPPRLTSTQSRPCLTSTQPRPSPTSTQPPPRLTSTQSRPCLTST